MCSDRRCTDGMTWCEDCNGHGVVSPSGKKYRVRRLAADMLAPVPHDACDGTGLRPCALVGV